MPVLNSSHKKLFKTIITLSSMQLIFMKNILAILFHIIKGNKDLACQAYPT